MNTLKVLAASAVLIAAGSAFASYDDGQSDIAWLTHPALVQSTQPIQPIQPVQAATPAPAPAGSSDELLPSSPRNTAEEKIDHPFLGFRQSTADLQPRL
jgi:hypothetical protein